MTEPAAPSAKRKPAHPALASRILAVGASAAATIGLVGAMAARPPVTSTPTSEVVAQTPPRPIHVVVVVKRQKAAPVSVTQPSSVRLPPRIIRRYVRAPVRTSSRGS